MTISSLPSQRRFWTFYKQHFQMQHTHPGNIAMHLLGTVGSFGFAVWAVISSPLLLLGYPVVHALPGLIGHRLFERDALVGDFRLTRKDFSLLWFIAANHVLAVQLAARAARALIQRKARHEECK
jgi:hypothetical protein